MSLTIYQVDSFTPDPFKGNPAGVTIMPAARDEVWMQNVAREMNLSETAFLVQRDDGSYDLRWFTPAVEVELCGHATLASAHILWEIGFLLPNEEARFHTKSGLLTARRDGDWIELDFPARPAQPVDCPPGLAEALGATLLHVNKTRYDYLVEVESERTVRQLSPDFGRLKALGVRGVIVTSRATMAGYDFVSRFFVPDAGIDEDPVTGSAHCSLGSYWADVLGKTEFLAYQASARGGTVRVRVDGERIKLQGQAVTVMRAELTAE
ncbi:MAG TPA: PhzF family phenazine biosynthesis protein [Acidobacteriota bacterium]|nr:PhzF family phenazine biosynthesis protein [Acidobacteriota bacterium]